MGQHHPANARNLNVQSVMAESNNNIIEGNNLVVKSRQAKANLDLRKTFNISGGQAAAAQGYNP